MYDRCKELQVNFKVYLSSSYQCKWKEGISKMKIIKTDIVFVVINMLYSGYNIRVSTREMDHSVTWTSQIFH